MLLNFDKKQNGLLSLEKATVLSLDRGKGGVAEIVRLTTAKDNLRTIYIYTPVAPARLYKRGHPYIQDEKSLKDERGVILKFDVNALRNYSNLKSAG